MVIRDSWKKFLLLERENEHASLLKAIICLKHEFLELNGKYAFNIFFCTLLYFDDSVCFKKVTIKQNIYNCTGKSEKYSIIRYMHIIINYE